MLAWPTRKDKAVALGIVANVDAAMDELNVAIKRLAHRATAILPDSIGG